MTIRSWFARAGVTTKPRSRVHGGGNGVATVDPPHSEKTAQNVTANPPSGSPNGAGTRSILVAVQKTGDDNRCVADLVEDVHEAERVAAGWVEAGVDPKAVSALRARELPLKVSYQWAVKISDAADPASGRRSRRPPARPAASPPPQPTSTSSADKAPDNLSRAGELLHEIVPEAPFQLRLDRVLWLGLWAASLFVLSLLLVASLSGGSEREFVIGGQPPPSEAANITSGQPGAAIPSLAVGAPSPLPSCLQGSVNECQCQDFAYQGDAQKFFTAYAPPARQPVDPDGDGLVCEWLSRRPGT